MPVIMNGDEYKWGRYGGIESDNSLDQATILTIVKWKHEIPQVPSTGPSTRYATPDEINMLRITDFGFNIPSDVYISNWDLGTKKIKIDFTEYVTRSNHTYSSNLTSDKNGNGAELLCIDIKGHDFDYTWERLGFTNFENDRKPYFFHKIKKYPIGPNGEDYQLELIGYIFPVKRKIINDMIMGKRNKFTIMNNLAVDFTKKIGKELKKTTAEIEQMIESFNTIDVENYKWKDWNTKINQWIYP